MVRCDWRKSNLCGHRVALSAALLALSSGCTPEPAVTIVSGEPEQGRAIIQDVGCGSCHQIPGIDAANGEVGPPLNKMARRAYIAGVLPNKFPNMVIWLQDPHGVAAETAMPATGLDEAEAQHVTAYLYTLK